MIIACSLSKICLIVRKKSQLTDRKRSQQGHYEGHRDGEQDAAAVTLTANQMKPTLLVKSVLIQFLFSTQCILIIAVVIIASVLFKYVRSQQRLSKLASLSSPTSSTAPRDCRGRRHGGDASDSCDDFDSQFDVSGSFSDNVFESTKSTCSLQIVGSEGGSDDGGCVVEI